MPQTLGISRKLLTTVITTAIVYAITRVTGLDVSEDLKVLIGLVAAVVAAYFVPADPVQTLGHNVEEEDNGEVGQAGVDPLVRLLIAVVIVLVLVFVILKLTARL